MAQSDLRRVERCAKRLEKMRVELRDAILVASCTGESIRDIAPFALLSPSRVHELLEEGRRLKREQGHGPDESVR